MKCPVVCFEASMGLVWLLVTCMLMLRVVFLHCWRISLVCLVGSWVEFGFSVGLECFGLALVDQYSLESGVFWCSQVLDLSLLPLAFSLILTVASRLLYPYSTNDKTSRLMVKRFSTVRDTQKSLQRYMEKRRRRKEVEVTRREEGNQKGREKPIPYVLHSLDTQRDSQS